MQDEEIVPHVKLHPGTMQIGILVLAEEQKNQSRKNMCAYSTNHPDITALVDWA